MAGINIKFREVEKILKANGFKRARTSGDHVIFKKGERHISIPCHKVNGIVLQRLFKENNIKF